jgi:hypothetical protein
MLEFIGFIALIYLAFKYLPDFLMFLVKLVVGLIVLILFFYIVLMIFTFIPLPLIVFV